MKKLFALTLLSLFASGGAFAAANEGTNPQQEKMKACQAQATEKKLEKQARQDYVNTCLKTKKESKMAMCNKKTAGMKQEERSKAQSDCMKAA